MNLLKRFYPTYSTRNIPIKNKAYVQGEVRWEGFPIKNVVLTLLAYDQDKEKSRNLATTTTATNGCFSFCVPSLEITACHYLAVRICSFLVLPDTKCAFPLFLGIESFDILNTEEHYHLGIIPLRLQWSFCERPLIFQGYIFKQKPGEIDTEEKIVRIRTTAGYTINETTTDLDGSYHVAAYADDVLKKDTNILIDVIKKGTLLESRMIPLNPADHVYDLKIKIP
jgi:hypothetical protein